MNGLITLDVAERLAVVRVGRWS